MLQLQQMTACKKKNWPRIEPGTFYTESGNSSTELLTSVDYTVVADCMQRSTK